MHTTSHFDAHELLSLLDTLNMSQLRALVYQRVHPDATKEAIAERFNLSVSAVEKAQAFLRKNGFLPRFDGRLQKNATVNVNDQVKDVKEPSHQTAKAPQAIANNGDPLASRLLGYGVRPRAVERILSEWKDRKALTERLDWHQFRLDNGFQWREGYAPAALLTWLLVNPTRDVCPPGFYKAQQREQQQAEAARTAAEHQEPEQTQEELHEAAVAEGATMTPEQRLQTVLDMLQLAREHGNQAARRMAHRLAEDWGVPLELLEPAECQAFDEAC